MINEGGQRVAVIIEDDIDISALLEAILEQAGFVCHVASTGDLGVELVQQHRPILTTLDVSLPGFDGLEVARRIRAFSDTYVIILSAKDEEIDVLMGLNAGADEYVTKPFRPRELRARVEAVLRRRELWAGAGRPVLTGSPGDETVVPTADAPRPVVPAGASPGSAAGSAAPTPGTPPDPEAGWLSRNGLRVHAEMRLCEVDGRAIDLTRSEFDLLVALVERDRRVASKDVLVLELRHDIAGGYVSDADRRSVEVHLANLRRKLGDAADRPRFIETVRGVGYRLAAVRH